MPVQHSDRPLASDIAAAMALLTRLPVAADHVRGARAAWAWPLAGAVVGAVAVLAGLVALALALPAAVTAGLVLGSQVVVTGAMHEDGLADCADGLWGGLDRARRLEIMRDSRIGSYGVLALILSLGLRWAALTSLIGAGHLVAPVVAAAALSRAPMAVLMRALPAARADGLSHGTGRPPLAAAQIACGLAFVLALLCVGVTAIPVALGVAGATLAVALISRAKIGGQTGDILGATQQVAEIAALALMAAAIT